MQIGKISYAFYFHSRDFSATTCHITFKTTFPGSQGRNTTFARVCTANYEHWRGRQGRAIASWEVCWRWKGWGQGKGGGGHSPGHGTPFTWELSSWRPFVLLEYFALSGIICCGILKGYWFIHTIPRNRIAPHASSGCVLQWSMEGCSGSILPTTEWLQLNAVSGETQLVWYYTFF